MAALGISQPTLSRTIQSLSQTVSSLRIPGERTPRYALLATLPLGLGARQRIVRHLASGAVAAFADIEFLAGGATLERTPDSTRLYEGLPPYLAFAAPSGFLGRQTAQQEAARSSAFPASLKDWDDGHRIAYLLTRGVNLPGNLVFGELSLQWEMEARAATPTPRADTLAHYRAMALALKGAAQGSSAGGEQPKFLALVEDSGHVLVKFAKRGSRMADLLPLEHLALRSLAEVGVAAASTRLLADADFVFLEVKRFDRVASNGRVGMLSAGAVDDEFFGRRDNWSAFAARCVQARHLSAADALRIDTMAAFSELIGNSDRHFENISLLIGEDGEYSGVAPAYDILPMRYASIGGGVDPELTPITPRVGPIGAQTAVWELAAQAAQGFWMAVQQEQSLAVPISDAMRQLAAINLDVALRFAAPLRRQ